MTDFQKKALALFGVDPASFDEKTASVAVAEGYEVAGLIESAMAERYPSERFELVSFNRRSYDQHYHEVWLRAASKPDQPFAVVVTENGPGWAVRDGYYGATRDAAYEAYMQAALGPVVPGLRVIATLDGTLPADVTPDTPIAEVAARENLLSYVSLILPPGGDFDALDERLWQAVQRKGLRGCFVLYRLRPGVALPEDSAAADELLRSREAADTVYSDRRRHPRR